MSNVHKNGHYVSLLCKNNQLFVASNSHVSKLDLSDGSPIFTTNFCNALGFWAKLFLAKEVTMEIFKDGLLCGCGGNVFLISPDDGSLLWNERIGNMGERFISRDFRLS